MTNEIYRLTLEHYFDDGENRHKIDEPIVVQTVHMTEVPVSICLNHMLYMMRRELLRTRAKDERTD